MEDKQILLLFNTDDKLALEKLFAKYYRPLTIYGFKYLDEIEVAEDIVQDVIVRFWETKKYLNVCGSLRNYLFTAVRNRAINYLESFHYAKKSYLDLLDESFLFEQFLDEELEERSEKLRLAMTELPDKMRQILQLIIFENKPQNEVAMELNISLNTVKTQLARAKQKLKTSVSWILLILLN
ncbi:MAG: RNA polymerase sigma factor [Mangrovibacterium sp.]